MNVGTPICKSGLITTNLPLVPKSDVTTPTLSKPAPGTTKRLFRIMLSIGGRLISSQKETNKINKGK